jgi:hypothetical protein
MLVGMETVVAVVHPANKDTEVVVMDLVGLLLLNIHRKELGNG